MQSAEQRPGQFVISLDFELNWGMFDVNRGAYDENILNVREVLPKMISLFKKYEIHVTWATVGLLFCEDKEAVESTLEKIQPTYFKLQYNPIYHMKNIGENEKEDLLHYGKTLIDEIKKVPFQEIATHTFSHYYCLEEGQTVYQFKKDLQVSKKIHEKNNVPMKSIVFPRNQKNDDYLSACKEVGITSYRGNRNHFIYNARRYNHNLLLKGLRLLDSYVNISGHHLSSVDIDPNNEIVNIPESMFLRPYNQKLHYLETLKEKRIMESMKRAAKEKKRYHLWWHPHNFGKHVDENIAMLERILVHFHQLKRQYHFQSYTMAETVERDFFKP